MKLSDEQKFDLSFLDKNFEKSFSTMAGGMKKKKISKKSSKKSSKKTTKKSTKKITTKKKTKKTTKRSKTQKGGFEDFSLEPNFQEDFKTRIPAMSDKAVSGVQKIVGLSVNTMNKFMSQLEHKFDQSVKAAENIKIGDQRLIHNGGAKKKKTTKKTSTKKKSSSKKTTKKKTSKRKTMKGGDGSDFALTLNSRGPANYPDNGWFNGKQLFHTFTKTGEYIPNSRLPYAAAPISTLSNPNPNNIITGYDNLGQSWAPITN
jgi:hypothetical protein